MLLADFARVKPTNFAGYDEWLIFSQVARGITDVPYANRPLELLFSLPVRLLPVSLWSWYALHVLHLAGAGCLVFALALRLLPGQPLVAFLAGVFAATWAPLDHQRLNVVQPYAAYSFWTCAALLLLVESWRRRHALLLCLACLLAFVDIRAYEAGLALLFGAPLLLWLLPGPRPPKHWTWIAAWEAMVLLAAALVALPHLLPGSAQEYQQMILGGVDLHPPRLLLRLLAQYDYHLRPLVATAPAALAEPAVALALAAFAVPFGFLAAKEPSAELRARDAGAVALLGFVLAGLAYAVLVTSPKFFLASRAQFLSAPGIALFLAGGAGGLASLAPARWRGALLGLLGAWVVAVGAERTLFLQRHWDTISVYPEQMRLLREMVGAAPRFQPNTLVLLIDEADVFKATFPFRHALTYLYDGDAIGHALGKWDFGYPIRITDKGVVSEPWPILRRHEAVTFHRFDEVVLLHQPRGGPLRLVEAWPAGALPPLPPGARYEPRARIRSGAPAAGQRLLAASLP